MDPNRYVILSVPAVTRSEFGPSPGIRGKSRSAPERGEGTELKVNAASLGKREIEELRRDPEVMSFAPVMPLRLHEPVARSLPVAAGSKASWGIEAVGADQSPFTGAGAKVAVLDTGIDKGHAAFTKVSILERDFTGDGNGDTDGHGTHCAGTIFGSPVDGVRIGVAPGIEQALIGKVLGREGGSSESISEAIRWALDQGANVISMSLGIDFPGFVERLVKEAGFPVDLATSKALEAYRANVLLFSSLASFAVGHGALLQASVIVAASGNESRREENPEHEIAVAPPAAAEGILAVGALGRSAAGLRVADFSNTKVDLSAPGVDIVSAAAGGGLVGMSGTSMATPHVAGVAALWFEKLMLSLGRVDSTALMAKLVGNTRLDALAPGFEALDVGTGLVRAPLD